MNIPKMTPDTAKAVVTVKKPRSMFWHDAKIVALTYLYTALTVLVVLGVAYVTNFKVTIARNVQTVSPISMEK